MTINASTAALKELAKKFLDFKYVALDADATAYAESQTGPLSEVTTNGGSRGEGTATHDAATGVVTITKTFTFTGAVTVNAICPMNSGTAGAGVMLTRFIPETGSLPAAFGNGGSLMVSFTCSMANPAGA